MAITRIGLTAVVAAAYAAFISKLQGPSTLFSLASIMRDRVVSQSGDVTDGPNSYLGNAADTIGFASRMRDRVISQEGTVTDGVVSLRGLIEDP